MISHKQITIIHFLRHGAVENPKSIRYGRLPGIHLSEVGRRHVESLSSFFLNRAITTIYSSPLERTQQTATLIGLALPHVPIVHDARLLEVKLSSQYEGKRRDISFAYPIDQTREAETVSQVLERVAMFIEEKVITHSGSEIIAVSHADPIALITNQLVFGDEVTIRDPYPNYGSINSCVYSGLDLVESWYYDSLIKFEPNMAQQ
jgi:broad specificity phosphatase PhoE